MNSFSRFETLVSELCQEIDDLNFQLETEREKAAHWRNEHSKLVDSSLKHSQEAMGGWITAILDKRITINE